MDFSLGPTIDNFAAAVAEFHKKAQKEGREEVVRALQGFFESTPEIDEITWRQYTPHWNDGDACEFSIGNIYFKWTGKESSKSCCREEDDAYTSAWSVGYMVKKGQTQYEELSKKLQTLRNAINSNQKAFEVIFGDPADVTIRRDGSVEVEEFDHD